MQTRETAHSRPDPQLKNIIACSLKYEKAIGQVCLIWFLTQIKRVRAIFEWLRMDSFDEFGNINGSFK